MKWVNLLFISLLVFLHFPVVAEAAISKINFTTEPQSVGVNALSEALTIQAQDYSGNSIETTETLDLLFTSSSGTGEFLGGTGNVVTKTMNRNTANRTFYYRDPKEGTHIITVTATGRDSGLTWSASQQISVGTSATQSGIVLGASTIASSGASATTGSTPVSKTVISSTFEIYGGADRLTSAGSPINFQALAKKGDSASKVDFSWSFGDGSVGAGENPVHTYIHPGTYAVVVTSKTGKQTATSRLKVMVIEPKLSVSVGEGFVEIKNSNSEEINLFNWRLVSGIKSFIFQPDTIILPDTSVRFDNLLLKFNAKENGEVVLLDSLGRPLGEGSHIEDTSLKLEELQARIDELQKQVASLGDGVEVSLGEASEPESPEASPRETAAAVLSSASSSIVIYEALPEKKTWFTKLFDFFSSSE